MVSVPFPVRPGEAGSRVDAFLAARLNRYSRAQVQRLILEGRVFLRERAAKASSRVAEGETVLVRYPRREEEPARYEALAVLYEDEALLAVDKPGDLLSHPTDKVVANAATSVLKAQFPKERLCLVHRLDRETSGVLLLAKTVEAARALAAQFEGRSVRKTYLAVVSGKAAFARREVDLPIAREEGEIKVRQAARAGGEPAVTEFERLGASARASLLAARPRTGRLHQIRVHAAALGHPLLGDKLYQGSGEAYMKAVRRELTEEDRARLGAPRQMLHAWRLRLRHPGTGRALELEVPLPEDFRSCLMEHGLPSFVPGRGRQQV